MATKRAKLFLNGGSQAVRLPKEFRFEGNEVTIRRQGRKVVLEPVDEWSDRFTRLRVDDDFERGDPGTFEPREALD